MSDEQVKQARELIRNKPYLMWYTHDYDSLSPDSVFESIISYGDWSDFIKIIEIFGIKKSTDIFNTIKNRKRNNLKPRTLNFFSRYFDKYANT